MHVNINGFTPARCRHCNYGDSWLWPVVQDFKRYSCPTCGEYRISDAEQAAFDAGRWENTGHFHTDDDGVRWLMS